MRKTIFVGLLAAIFIMPTVAMSEELFLGEPRDTMGAEIAKKYSIPYQILGEVGGETLEIECKAKKIMHLYLKNLSDAWRNAIPSRLRD